ncbi:MAG: S8 family serine peptidase [Clostridia bacterium]|nr:S8 family serine peptidase [Clostridia bacterium]
MKYQRICSLIVIVALLAGIGSLPLSAYGAQTDSADAFAQKLETLNEQALESDMTMEEMVEARIILKASADIPRYGNAEYIKGYRNLYVFQYPSHAQAEEALAYYSELPAVQWVQWDKLHEAKGECMRSVGVKETMEYIAEQSIETAALKVAVIDTGVDTKSELYQNCGGRLVDTGYNTANTGYRWTAHDDFGHGTNVCEIIYANTPESVSVYAYKALNMDGEGDEISVAMCIDKAIEDGNSVINLSLGGAGETDPCIKEALQRAYAADITVVVAAGNESVNVAECTPACEDEVLCVAAIDRNGNPESYSNFGDGVDFCAPGDSVTTTYSIARNEYEEEIFGREIEYEGCTGTSFATPFVAAAAATVKAVHPQYRSADIEQALKDSCYTGEQLYSNDSIHPLEGRLFEFLCRGAGDYHAITRLVQNPPDNALYYGNGMPEPGVAIGMERCREVAFTQDIGANEEVFVEMSAEEDSRIFYTEDGSFPYNSETVQQYTQAEEGGTVAQPLEIQGFACLRAVACKSGKSPSIVTAAEFFAQRHASQEELTIGADGYITQYTGNDSSIVIPETINGIQVTGLGADFTAPTAQLNAITLPDSAKRVLCHMPQTLVYFKAPGLEQIGDECFADTNLAIIEAPSVTKIGKNAFRETLIRQAYFPHARIDNGAFYFCRYLKTVECMQKSRSGIPEDAFCGCLRLKTVNIHLEPYGDDLGDNNIYIGIYAFCGCVSLQNFDFSKVTSINRCAFYNVRAIRVVNAPMLNTIESLPVSTEILYAPRLKRLKYAPVAGEVPMAIVSRTCTVNSISSSLGFDYHGYWYEERGYTKTTFEGYSDNYKNLVICSDENSDVKTGTLAANINFLHTPAIASQPEEMGAKGGTLEADGIGINITYQWYGTNLRNNHTGTKLEGEVNRTLESDKYDYRYYYCEITHNENLLYYNGYTIENGIRKVRTGYGGEDVNEDTIVDFADVSQVLAQLGQEASDVNITSDIDGNAVIDIADISMLLLENVYGKEQVLQSVYCPAWKLLDK